jgi:hypothetical protein
MRDALGEMQQAFRLGTRAGAEPRRRRARCWCHDPRNKVSIRSVKVGECTGAMWIVALYEVFAPREMGYDYMGLSFQFVIFGFSLLFVFPIPAALCESWPLPFGVLLSTPVAVFGAFAVLWPRQRHRHFPGLVATRLDRLAVTRV